MGISDHLTCFLKNLYAGQEATDRTRHGKTVQFSCSVVSDSLRPHGLQHARLPCSSPTPGACSNSCPSTHQSWSQWHHLAISSSVIPFSSCLQTFPTSRSWWPEYWSFNFSISPSNEYSRLISFRIYWLDLIGVQGTLKSLLQHHSSKASIIWCSPFFTVQLTSIHDTGKTIALTRQTFVGKVMSLLFNMLSRFIVSLKDSVSAPTLFSFNIALAIQVFWLSR